MGGPGSGRKAGSTNKSSHNTSQIRFGKSIQQGKGTWKNFEKKKKS